VLINKIGVPLVGEKQGRGGDTFKQSMPFESRVYEKKDFAWVLRVEP
jgi:hypothetical protein